MGYEFIPVIASVALVIHHVLFTEAAPRSKLVIGALVGASLVIWRCYPQWSVPATLVQVGAGIYMLLYLRVHENAGR